MPFSSLSPSQRIRVLLGLEGGPEYNAEMKKAAVNTAALGKAVKGEGAAMAGATRQSFLHNQSLYTFRRYAFYATTGALALTAAVIGLGFSYNNALQTSRVALRPVIKDQRTLNAELGKLYTIAALSPLNFSDTVTAFRTIYSSFHSVGLSAQFANNTISAITDALSFQGKTAPGQINKVAVQLNHLAQIGRPTGQILLALVRDGLPVYAALRKELGMTGTSLENVAKSGLTAQQVIAAVNKFVATTPGYMNAAMRQSNRTLSGAWQQFRDILSQAAGRGEVGLFGGLQHVLAGVNNSLAPLLKNNKPITLYNIASALDQSLTPRTHAFLNVFILLSSTLKTVITEFAVLIGTVSLLLYPIDKLTGLFGANHLAMRIMGVFLGTLITLWALYKARQEAVVIWTGINLAVQKLMNKTLGVDGIKAMLRAILGLKAYAFEMRKVTVAEELATAGAAEFGTMTYVNTGILARFGRLLYGTVIPAITGAAAATWGWAAANLVLLGWIGLIIAIAAGLVVLYYKWKPFHDIVNKTFNFIRTNWNYVEASLLLAFGPLIEAAAAMKYIVDHWNKFKEAAHSAVTGSSSTLNAQGIPTHRSNNTGLGFSIPSIGQLIRYHPFASGGFVSSTGTALVGEHGPELVNLPGGSRVINHRQLENTLTSMPDGIELSIVVKPQHLIVDGMKLATSIATVVTSVEARQ